MLFRMGIETLGEAWEAGWRLTARCAWGTREGLKSIRECQYRRELDFETLVWTRGRDMPLAWLKERLRRPRCGLRRVSILFQSGPKPGKPMAPPRAQEERPPRPASYGKRARRGAKAASEDKVALREVGYVEDGDREIRLAVAVDVA